MNNLPVNARPLQLQGLSGKLAGLEFGDPSLPPMLALHGWLDNAASFVPLSREVQDYHIVALDLPGHGHSAHRPAGSKYHMVDYVADIAHAVADLGWSEFTMLGHSLGAGIALMYAASYAEKIDKLILIDGVGPLSAPADTATARLRKSIDTDLAYAEDSRPPRKYQSWDKLITARQMASPIETANAELLVRRNAKEVDDGILLQSDRRLKGQSALYMSEDVVGGFIDNITAPTLLLLANDGVLVNRGNTAKRIDRFKQIQVEHCSGRHHVHMDQPAEMAGWINRFQGRSPTG